MQITSLAVFCGSKSGNNPLFEAHAKTLGHILANKNITLIYGGGNKGIMGAVANAVLEKNGKVIGIIPARIRSITCLTGGTAAACQWARDKCRGFAERG